MGVAVGVTGVEVGDGVAVPVGVAVGEGVEEGSTGLVAVGVAPVGVGVAVTYCERDVAVGVAEAPQPAAKRPTISNNPCILNNGSFHSIFSLDSTEKL
jgi:hypothetical protein